MSHVGDSCLTQIKLEFDSHTHTSNLTFRFLTHKTLMMFLQIFLQTNYQSKKKHTMQSARIWTQLSPKWLDSKSTKRQKNERNLVQNSTLFTRLFNFLLSRVHFYSPPTICYLKVQFTSPPKIRHTSWQIHKILFLVNIFFKNTTNSFWRYFWNG